MSAPAVTGLNCPACGAAVELRAGAVTETVVCSSCHAVLDAKDPGLRVLQAMQKRLPFEPVIPLGTRGKVRGDPYEAIGFQVRSITVDGTDYYWREYVLWNPYKGFRYLTEYDGHWNDVTIAKSTPGAESGGRQPTIEFIGQTFRHFQSAMATTRYILGEFPWKVRVGDVAGVHDFVAPPYMLSRETTQDEVTWSLGTYVAPERVWEWFQLPGAPRAPSGVFANQPNPRAGAWQGVARVFALFVVLVVVLLAVRLATAQRREVYRGQFAFTPAGNGSAGGSDSAAFVTPLFAIGGRTSNVEVRIDTDVSNNWAYFNLALINEATGAAYDFGREVSYYFGRDSDGSWSEGSRRDVSYLPTVPAGRYYLRVQPEGNPLSRDVVGYTIRVRRDVPRSSFYVIALLVLAVPPVLAAARSWGFESARWKESDHAPSADDD
jgi:hypothetical protein